MDFLSSLFMSVVPFLVILTILVFVHELGHYLAARMNGVKVEVFSIGFGPEIFGFNDKAGTRWKFSALPLGGYVKMFSDANAASQPDQDKIKVMSEEDKKISLVHKTVWQRIQVSAAGPLANYVFAALILAVIFSIHGQQIPTDEARVGIVIPNSAAAKAGLMQNDEVVEIDGQAIAKFVDMQAILKDSANKELTFIIKREDTRKILAVTPDAREAKDENGNDIQVGVLGITSGSELVKRSPLSSLWHASKYTIDITVKTLQGVGQMIMGTRSTDGLSGPLGIAKMTSEIAQTNFVNILWFMAFISINLGLINLFPIPMLDGGHLLFYFIEAIIGRPVSEKAQEWGFRIGLIIILCLFLLGTWNDLSRFEWLRNLFN